MILSIEYIFGQGPLFYFEKELLSIHLTQKFLFQFDSFSYHNYNKIIVSLV